MKQTQSAVPTNPSAASLGRDRSEKSEITDIGRFCFAFWELPSTTTTTTTPPPPHKTKHNKTKQSNAQHINTRTPPPTLPLGDTYEG